MNSKLVAKVFLFFAFFGFDCHLSAVAFRLSPIKAYLGMRSMIGKSHQQRSPSVQNPGRGGFRSTNLTSATSVQSRNQTNYGRQYPQSQYRNATISDILSSITGRDQLVVVLVGLPGKTLRTYNSRKWSATACLSQLLPYFCCSIYAMHTKDYPHSIE